MSSSLAGIYSDNYPESCSRVYLENILISLDYLAKNKLDDLVWKIKNLNIDFSTIQALKISHPKWAESFSIDILIFSKIMFLENVQNYKSLGIIRYKFDSIIKTLYFLATNNILIINQNNYVDFLTFFLMHRIENNKAAIKLNPLSFSNYSNSISNRDWDKTLKRYMLPSIGYENNFSDSFVNRSLKAAIEKIGDGEIGFGDWKAGGSFNCLTLDYGKYYIHHCSEIFDKHIGIAIALRQTLTQAGEIVSNAGLMVNTNNLRTYVMLLIGHFLAGKEIKELPAKTLKKYSKSWFQAIQISTIDIFKRNLLRHYKLQELLTDECVSRLAKSADFHLDHEDKNDWLKQIISIRWSQFDQKGNTAISIANTNEFNCFQTIISKEKISQIIKSLDAIIISIDVTSSIKLPTPEFFRKLGIVEKGPQSKYVNNFLRFIECSGAVKFVALTGWRESEYGFGLSNISCSINQDILDQYSNPINYKISWVVPKTNGNTHLNREITYEAYSTALKLSALVESDSNLPCLYAFNKNMTNPNDSKETIPRLTSFLWSNFVTYYSAFHKLDLIDELSLLETKQDLSEVDKIRLIVLKKQYAEENWGSYESDINLREVKLRSKNEFDRVKFLIDQDDRRGFIWKYKTGTLNSLHTSILDIFLSEETKKVIFNFQSATDISPVFTRSIINEIIQDCLYPTPHSLRHMWAEAVYRRFDGDAGWMIRSNFKHISPSMWLAYIRDKDNRRHNDSIKRQVISSLLNNYIKKAGHGYAGPLDKLLRRLFNITHVTKPEKIASFVEQFALNEIENIKSTDWGFCLLMKRNKANAKCAEQGVPQRHKASPALCLGCLNNLTQTGNIEGILLGISNDLNVIKEHAMPNIFFNESFKTVSNALKHLTKLKADREILVEIQECLESNSRGS
jgi:hypothetical protein